MSLSANQREEEGHMQVDVSGAEVRLYGASSRRLLTVSMYSRGAGAWIDPRVNK